MLAILLECVVYFTIWAIRSVEPSKKAAGIMTIPLSESFLNKKVWYSLVFLQNEITYAVKYIGRECRE